MSNHIPPIFINAHHQVQFENDGFLKIKLLEDEDIVKLKKLYTKHFPNPSQDFFSSSYENDFILKKEISDAIGATILPRLKTIFRDYTCFGSAFLSKGNGARSEMPMHQDWTIVDETKYVALNIWTPLQETNENNGTLEVIKGSHHWHNVLRAPTLPFYYNGFQNQLKSLLTAVPTMATEAVVLNQAVIHYSKPNKTNSIRLAITTGIKSQDAPMIFHYWDKTKPEIIEMFKEEDDFLIRFTDFHQSIFKRPTLGTSIGTKAFTYKTASAKEVAQLITVEQKNNEPIKKSFAKKLVEWIKG